MWEEGKRIHWFEDQAAQEIVNGNDSYKKLYTTKESVYYVNSSNSFNKPRGFDQALANIKLQFVEET